MRGLSPYKEECYELMNLKVNKDFYLCDVILEYNNINVILRDSLIIVSGLKYKRDRKRFKYVMS
jgi:hypothetical protein